MRNKIVFVLALLFVFRLMANIPIFGVNRQNLANFFDQFQVFGLLNVFTGGALDQLSIVMLGVGPYITATIVLQLLTMIFPAMERMYKEEGEAGRQKFNQYGRILTVPLALLQSYAMIILFSRQGIIDNLNSVSLAAALITITAGSVFLMWLGELISEKGIGNGLSLLIFAGIISEVPNNISQIIFAWDSSKLPGYIFFFAASLLIIALVVLITEARRNIQVSYAKRVRGNKMYGGANTYLPLSVNPAGVIPIIFALSILVFPGMIANFLSSSGGIVGVVATKVGIFLQDPWANGILYFILVVVFTYFYTAVTFDPKAISDNLQRMGGFVPGIRPGEPTARFIHYILNRVLLIGALFLGSIAVMPSIVGGVSGIQSFSFLIGGTSLLIVVSVVLETMRQVNSQLQMREYDTF